MEREVPERRPALARMVVEGRVIVDRLGTAERLKEWCAAVLDAGPAPPTAQEIADARYGITDAVDDIVGGLEPGEVA
ncbi:MAG: nucleotidyltransferase domain-containing protein, partial [Actinobacteria bacterium]|nr:nucleotidyltransferase domain-containing protein [Actinomycetota bacterium]